MAKYGLKQYRSPVGGFSGDAPDHEIKVSWSGPEDRPVILPPGAQIVFLDTFWRVVETIFHVETDEDAEALSYLVRAADR